MDKPTYSFISFWCAAALIFAAAFFYYPKWKQHDTEATLSWDVSGYYLYLPAACIYHDLKKLDFAPELLKKYNPAPGFDQAFLHPSGNRVMKYSCGQALQFLPWFFAGHLAAKIFGYPADGFSQPYQTAISWGSLLVALLGLWFLRKILLRYFSDSATAFAIFVLVFGSNYLNYTAFDGAMTHNWLFTLYTLLIFLSIKFYEKPSFPVALGIGMLCGWAVLTRPTEIISVLIPLLWFPPSEKWVGWRSFLVGRFQFFKNNFPKLPAAAAGLIFMAGIQLIYWKYTAGEWIVYSYGDQSFSWKHPHLQDGLMSARAGWLIYSPVMIFAVVGWLLLFRTEKRLVPASFFFLILFMYITWAWDIWWYGGSLGQRAMVQSYPVWAFSLAALFVAIRQNWLKKVVILLVLPCILFNLWITHHAHLGGLFVSEQMTKAYFLKILGKNEVEPDAVKLLDNKDNFEGQPENPSEIFTHDFENDTVGIISEKAISGNRSGFVDGEKQNSETWKIPLKPDGKKWLRLSAKIFVPEKEWEFWRMTQLVVRFLDGEKRVKENMIRLHRLADSGQTREVWLDAKFPKTYFDSVEIFIWNADGKKKLVFDDLKVIVF